MLNFERKLYLDKIKPFVNKPIIKILTGQRRVGKTYILLQIIDLLKKEDPNANIIYIDKEAFEFDFIKNYTDLYTYIQSKKGSAKNYVLIDEVQEIIEFQKTLRALLSEEVFDLYVTGSNASMLSGDLATVLSGRYVEIKVNSLSYPEFLAFHQLENTQDSLYHFLKFGGLPFLIHLERDEKMLFEYLRNINNTIFFKDIVSRFQLKNVSFLTDLTKFLADNCGSLFSAAKISQYLKSQQIKASVENIINYLGFLESAYFIHRIKRTDIEGKRHFEIGEKIYFSDLGLRNSFVGYRQSDIGKLMKNAVLLHLICNNWEVSVGASNNMEIDFVATRNGEKCYLQVAYLIESDATMNREFGNLLAIKDNFPKMVISMDETPKGNTYKGIEHVHLRDFLSQ